MATTLATRLVLDALNMALMTRRPRGMRKREFLNVTSRKQPSSSSPGS
jgi:hypothetical protein